MSIAELQEKKASGMNITALTAYDYPMGRLLDECGVDIILVGDSLGMVVLGYPDTTFVTMDEMIHHCRAVARAVKRAFLVADLPFGAYDSNASAVENAARLADAGAQAVKLEGGMARVDQIKAIVAAGIPVMAHLGMLPQSVREEGGYKIKGTTRDDADRLLEEAHAVEKAGAFAVVLELVFEKTASEITRALSIPTIGIGSGKECDGQVLVTHDLIGLFPWFKPKFVSARAHVAAEIRAAVTAFIDDVKSPG
jgi:3-methyl-2-oxobutanoate hydroxymethyltransferase